METVVSISKLPRLAEDLKRQKKSIVLVGGCFDVLHPGHVIFLEKANKEADVLMVLLESDQKVRQLKGINRPVHNQKERAKILAALRSVNYVVMLPFIDSEKDYDELTNKIKPEVIAATKGISDHHHKRSAQMVGAKLKYVTDIIGDYSTTRILGY